MKSIQIADQTLCNPLRFRDKLVLAKALDELGVDILEFPVFDNSKQDALLIRTVASFLTAARISVGINSAEGLEAIKPVLEVCNSAIVRIEIPTSTVGMEYFCHKKAPKMLEWLSNMLASLSGVEVEVCALDATRAEPAFLAQLAQTARQGGAHRLTLCDTGAVAMPDTFGDWVKAVKDSADIAIGVCTDNTNGMAMANALVALKHGGADLVKTSVQGQGVLLASWGALMHNCGLNEGLCCRLDHTRLPSTLQRLQSDAAQAPLHEVTEDDSIRLDKEDSADTVRQAVIKIGYDLTEDDHARVYEEFLRVAAKKSVGAKELDAIVSSAAQQVPSLYKVESFVINNSNLFSASAQVTLSRDGVGLQGICFADGPIAAAFAALQQIVGQNYELDDFQIAALTEGQGAVGKAIVKLRKDGKVYCGIGISTDIIGASIRAYVAAVNKIAYEEA